MRKIIIVLCLGFLVSNAEAWRENEKRAPWDVYAERTTDALDVYVTGTDVSKATVTVTVGVSLVIGVEVDGTGYTYTCDFTSPSYNTLRKVITWGASITTATISISHPSPVFAIDTTTSTQLATKSATWCLGSTNTVTLVVVNTLGFSYVIEAEQGKRQYVQGFDCNVTFGTGTTLMTIYDGIYASSDTIRKWEVETSVKGEEMPIKGVVRGTAGKPMRFDVAGSTWITAGWTNIEGYSK